MDLVAEIAHERRAVADMLESLTDEQWATASLAQGWTVRNVAAHLVMPFRYSMPKIMWQMLKAKGDFNKAADRVARRDAQRLSSAEIVDLLRRNADHRFKPPGAEHDAPLSDIIVHGLDMRVPLGIERDIPTDRLRPVLDLAMLPKTQKFYGHDLSGVSFVATDMDWRSGSGPEITGTAQDLVLVSGGRRAGLDRVDGPGVEVLRARR